MTTPKWKEWLQYQLKLEATLPKILEINYQGVLYREQILKEYDQEYLELHQFLYPDPRSSEIQNTNFRD
jgi:hypothetical protein